MGGYLPTSSDVAESDLADARSRIRIGQHTGPTSGLASGFAQANLVILPPRLMRSTSLRFCVRNPKPCPLLEVTDTGSPNPDDAFTRRRPAHRSPALPRVRRRRARRRADRRDPVLARRSGQLPARLLVHVRMGASRRRLPTGASTPGRQRSDVRHRSALHRRRPVRGSARRVDETLRARRHRALPSRSPRAFPLMHGGPVHVGDPSRPRHHRSGRARLRRSRDGRRRRGAGRSGRAA